MQIFFTYAVLEPHVAVPPSRMLKSFEEVLREQAKPVKCDDIERLRIQIVIQRDDLPTRYELDGRELVVTSFVAVDAYKNKRMAGKAAILHDVAAKVFENVVRRYECIKEKDETS